MTKIKEDKLYNPTVNVCVPKHWREKKVALSFLS